MCNRCHQPKCCCPDPCNDCIDPDLLIVRKVPRPNTCNTLVDTLREIVGMGKPKCKLRFAQAIVSEDTVTIVAMDGHGTLEYSRDGMLWQLSPTFLNQPNGTHKYYVREAENMACVAGGYATVNVACSPNWQNTQTPPVTECQGGKTHTYQADGCGNFRWFDTGQACGGCTPNWADKVPLQQECIDSSQKVRQQDGCGNERWRDTGNACQQCTLPSYGNISVAASTCASGQRQANASFSIEGIGGANRFAWSSGDTYTGVPYSAAQAISGSVISVVGLPGSDQDQKVTLRLFSNSDDCITDVKLTIPGTSCGCIQPSGTISKVDPTCQGTDGATTGTGKLVLGGIANATRVQLCEDTTFTCQPDYNSTVQINGSGPIDLKADIGFVAGQPHRDFTARLFNGNQDCFKDLPFRFINPCFVQNQCVAPTVSGQVATPATCNGTVVQNDAKIQLTGFANITRIGFSIGTVYSGPDFDNASNVGGEDLEFAGLPGASTATPVVFRLFNGKADCVTDITVNIPGTTCEDVCCDLQILSVTLVNA